jgi:hypothetical protein
MAAGGASRHRNQLLRFYCDDYKEPLTQATADHHSACSAVLWYCQLKAPTVVGGKPLATLLGFLCNSLAPHCNGKPTAMVPGSRSFAAGCLAMTPYRHDLCSFPRVP